MAIDYQYHIRIDDDPGSDTYGQAMSVHRIAITDDTVIMERYDASARRWVDNPNLIRATGIGGDEDYKLVSSVEALRAINSLR